MPDNDLRTKAALLILVVLGVLMFFRMRHPSTTFASDGIDPDWDTAARQSHDLRQPTVVIFTAGWCPACRSLHAAVLSREDVHEELHRHYAVYTVDLTHPSASAQAHAQKYGVRAIPLMIRFDANGQETDRTHYLQPERMIAWLKAGE